MWIVGAILGTSIFAIGFYKVSKMKKRKQFYEDFCFFLNSTEPEVSFFQNKTNQVFNVSGYKMEFTSLIDAYKTTTFNSNNDAFGQWFVTQNFLSNDDCVVIKKFLENFGRVDVEEQVKSIKNVKQFVLSKIDNETYKLKTSGKLTLSLSAMFGLVVFIIVL